MRRSSRGLPKANSYQLSAGREELPLPTSHSREKEDILESFADRLLEALLSTTVTLGVVAIVVGVLVLLGLVIRRMATDRC